MQLLGTWLVLQCLASVCACGVASTDSPPPDDTNSLAPERFVAVSMTGAGMNRACGSCGWELEADVSGVFTARDDEGTVSFQLTTSEYDRLMSVVEDARFAEALQNQVQCAGVIDASAVLAAEWEAIGRLVDERAVGCLSDPSHPYVPVSEALLAFHAAHFVCESRASGTNFRRALCIILPLSQQ